MLMGWTLTLGGGWVGGTWAPKKDLSMAAAAQVLMCNTKTLAQTDSSSEDLSLSDLTMSGDV
jgi:long-subunit fatty acid transport protein